MTFLLGKRSVGQAGRHWRDLAADASALRSVHGVDKLLLLVEDHELSAARVNGIESSFETARLELERLPIRDLGVPADISAFRTALTKIDGEMRNGRSIAIACLGGLAGQGLLWHACCATEVLTPKMRSR